MKRLIGITLLLAALGGGTLGQTPNNPNLASERVEKLRAELRDVLAKEAEMQARAQLLEIDLKPENIQRAISHIPSFNPDELRQQRRIYLEGEMTKTRLELEQLAARKSNLEAAITKAEIEAQKALAAPPADPPMTANAPSAEKPVAKPASQPALQREPANPAPIVRKKSRANTRNTPGAKKIRHQKS